MELFCFADTHAYTETLNILASIEPTEVFSVVCVSVVCL